MFSPRLLLVMLLGTMTAAVTVFSPSPALAAEEAAARCYEMRTYYAAPGKLEALQARFREHTCALFARHGITSIGYWVPMENTENKLVYLLSFASREARETAWKEFSADPDWIAARAASEKDGKLVQMVVKLFLQTTDFSPALPGEPAADAGKRVFELRTYHTTQGNLPLLLARFREHTVELFKKHGMTNIAYFTLQAGQPDAESTLIYFLAHPSKEAGAASFAAFRADPDWVSAKAASEKAGGGSLTVPDGVISEFLQPTDYSPLK